MRIVVSNTNCDHKTGLTRMLKSKSDASTAVEKQPFCFGTAVGDAGRSKLPFMISNALETFLIAFHSSVMSFIECKG